MSDMVLPPLFTPRAPRFGKDRVYFIEAEHLTDAELELGRAEVDRLRQAWRDKGVHDVEPHVWSEEGSGERTSAGQG